MSGGSSLETGQEAWDGAALSDRWMHLLVPANSLQRNNHAVNVTSQLPTESSEAKHVFLLLLLQVLSEAGLC